MIELLANIQPIVLIVLLILMYSIENLFPYLNRPANIKRHYRRNFTVSLISFIMNAGLGILVVMILEWTAKNNWGLLNHVNIPATAKVILGILLFDFGSYLTHNLQHKVPFLWRFHRIHHSDLHLNVSSSLRFHPIDAIVALFIYQGLAVAVLGISMTTFVIYGTIALPLLIMQHSNVKLPDWFERIARLVIATPGWHKIHHSAHRQLTDSHYGDVFTFWDRIFGTWGHTQPHEITYGLDEFKEDHQQKVSHLMVSPFKK
ncbi:Sterol desaturase/sphingolipid hydroxylase, fatty acid hydroxylase superfamily [Chitinophaga sp. YR573]|uniref:sterol desaturase family protein n=1 Tax=Chitinophaga sp. YR573 TaxID=1881040 RepID=UPI0008D46C6D|nr:sterol desaturase family protein [Chitinophaga sp. YR573]SEW38002.1 Sterol desaturase/sphingolipid hydroxylase, fatty acid hydroxylase superfamily [Chitinophaga sp. YR573]